MYIITFSECHPTFLFCGHPFFFCVIPPMYDLFMQRLCSLICAHPLLHRHSFVSSPSSVPPSQPPRPQSPYPPLLHPITDIYPCPSHITSTTTTAHDHRCRYILSQLSLRFLHPPTMFSYLFAVLHPPFPPLFISHPSLTLCICYMILHRLQYVVFLYSPSGRLKPLGNPYSRCRMTTHV